MTSYDAYKQKERKNQASADSARQKGMKYSVGAVRAGSARQSKEQTGSISAETRQKAPSAARTLRTRPDRSHNKSEMISISMIPKIFGLAQKKKFQTNKAEAVNRYPFAVGVAIIMLVTAMFMMLVVNAMSISSIKTANATKNAELEALIERQEELQLQLEKRDDLRYIEAIAKNKYGMIKKEYVTKHYISLGNEDKIEVIDKADSSDIIVNNTQN